MLNILITGGTGFIGSNTCVTLLAKNYNLFVVDSLQNSSINTLKNIKKVCSLKGIETKKRLFFYEGDIRYENLIEKIFIDAKKQGKNINGVIHFAGFKSIEESIINPIDYWENNLISTFNLCKIMSKFDCRNLVFSSSASIYNSSLNKLINENCEIKPLNPYGKTKYAIEQFLYDVYSSDSTKWKIANLRYFNPIGAHKSGYIGENPNKKPTNIFPLINQVAVGIREKIEIFGNDWPTIDGTCIRDYIHITDLAEGHLLVLENLINGKPKLLNLNLGTGLGTSVLELIKTYEEVNNVSVPYVITKRRKGDYGTVVADNSSAKLILNWSPTKGLKDMCKDGYRWQKNMF